MTTILFTVNTVAPVFLIIILGWILRKINFINENFISISSKLVFKFALPALIIVKVTAVNLDDLIDPKAILFAVIYLVVTFTICLVVGLIFFKDKSQVGVFAQAVFRGNYGIVAIAFLLNMFGELGGAKGAIILAVASPLYNILATIGLIVPHQRLSFESIKKILYKIITNPIIIALIISFIFLWIKWYVPEFKFPKFIDLTLGYVAAMALPVALIGIGGSLSFTHIRENKVLVIATTVLRMVISPLIFTVIAIFLGFRGESLAALYMLFGVPTAVASFVFALSMDGDSDLAANLVVTTTSSAVITVSLGVFLLRLFGFI